MLLTSCRTLQQSISRPGVVAATTTSLNNFSRRIGGNCQLNVVLHFASPYSGFGGSFKERSDKVITKYKKQKYFIMSPQNTTDRHYSVEPVCFTKNITIFSNQRKEYAKDNRSFRLHVPLDKPLVFIFAWLQASEKHLLKYVEFYIEQGFEVLSVHMSPWQLVWPVYGSQKVAGDVVKFLSNNDFPEGVVLHGFSVGGYLWGECLVKLNEDTNGKQILGKIRGQVWDSLADITEIPVGVPHALLPHNPTLQSVLRNYMTYHLKLFHEEATQYYVKCTHMFHYEPALCPALLLLSKNDRVGTEKANRRLHGIWDSLGMKTSMKCWDKSPHVGHFHKHRDEYIEVLQAHLKSLNLPMYNRKAKL